MVGKKKNKRIRIRNWLAVYAHNRTRAGPHLDKKKHKNKYKCRKTAKNTIILGGFYFLKYKRCYCYILYFKI